MDDLGHAAVACDRVDENHHDFDCGDGDDMSQDHFHFRSSICFSCGDFDWAVGSDFGFLDLRGRHAGPGHDSDCDDESGHYDDPSRKKKGKESSGLGLIGHGKERSDDEMHGHTEKKRMTRQSCW